MLPKLVDRFPPLDNEQKAELLSHVPRWHACAVGPTLDGQVQPLVASCHNMIFKTRDEAEDDVWDKIEAMMTENGLDFERYEWSLLHLIVLGGN